MSNGLKNLGLAGILAGSLIVSGCDSSSETGVDNQDIISSETLEIGDKVTSIISQCKFEESGEKNIESLKQVLSTCSNEVQEIAKKSYWIKNIIEGGQTTYYSNALESLKNIEKAFNIYSKLRPQEQEIARKNYWIKEFLEKGDTTYISNTLNAINIIKNTFNMFSKLDPEMQEIIKKDYWIKSFFENGETNYNSNTLEVINNVGEIFRLINENPSLKNKLGITRPLNEGEKMLIKMDEKHTGIKHTGELYVKIPSWEEFISGEGPENSIDLILGELKGE